MKIAVLDLGTNTFHLLIAEVFRDKTFKILFKTNAVVKLGKGSIGENKIARLPYERGIRAILRFDKQIKKYGADKIFAFATSAIRSSLNGTEFIRDIRQQTGIKIKVISGDEEAELIYTGITHSVKLDVKPVLMMDIGGGSTEFIIANDRKIFWKQSFNIGVARLLVKFNPSDPIHQSEITKINIYLDEILNPLQRAMRKHHVTTLIGSSGSFDTLSEMISYKLHGKNTLRSASFYHFNLKQVKEIHQWLLQSTLAMRRKTKGLVKMRADMIVVSSICVQYILKKFMIKEMILSRYALKEGALFQIVGRATKDGRRKK
jgi:exopolyphosphatase/guanosine-5'-triphosphate,3'-diphosphate pyrophosphatase